MMQRTAYAAALSLAVLAGCGGGERNGSYEERFTVKPVTIRDVIAQTGEVRSKVNVDLKSEASGRIEKIYVKEGQRVAKGDTILIIDPSRLLFKKDRLDLAVKRARIKREIARRNLEDAKALADAGTVSPRDVADLENEYELADIAYREQVLEWRDIADQLERTVVTSPMHGVITALEVEEGEIAVSATSGLQAGSSIARIADIDQLEVISQIGEVDYVHLDTGQSVTIKPEAREGTTTSGVIEFISLSAKKASSEELGTFEVRIRIDSLIEGIAPGINVNVEFLLVEKKDVLGVPNKYVREARNGPVVRVVRADASGNETIEPKKVTLGDTDYRFQEVTSGLSAGDVVYFREEAEGDARSQRGRKR
jgi:HlyD family secretion protein